MGKFTVIPQDTFSGLQLDAGVLLKKFTPATPAAPADEDIICATTGGINATCVPTYSDLGEDVDNCPVNMKELKHLDSWECKLSFTSLGLSANAIKLALGAADIGDTSASKQDTITPRRDLKQTDFTDLWWVGDRADGGCVAIQIKNALSTGGFSLQTTKNGKGQLSVELTGHVSIDAQDTMPMVFYSLDASE
uniref:Major tail protein n=1 Tax=Siphoviridae sp. ctkfT29 TaxID=2827278 RepID=A0A8S5R9M9_9CAUD|nr:MAG TPA: major tail protein [Siphoviridae sp. ctkfT29]